MKYNSTLKLFVKGYGKYKFRIAFSILLGFASGFLEALGITALVPLFSHLAEGGGSTSGPIKFLENILGWFDLGLGLKTLLAFIVLSFSFKALALIVSSYVSNNIASDYERETRRFLMDKTLKANWLFLLEQRIGYLETILLTDITANRKLFLSMSSMALNMVNLLVFALIAFTISPVITLLSLAVGGMILLILNPLLYIIRKLAASAAKTNAEVSHHVNQSIIGLKAIKASSAEESILKKANDYFDLLKYVNVRQGLFKSIPPSIVEPVSIIFISTVFAVTYVTSTFEIGLFAATMYLIHKIFSNIKAIQASLHLINLSLPHLERVVDYEKQVSGNEFFYGGAKPFSFKNHIEFRGVSFSYPDSEKIVLSDFSLRVKRGEMVCIVGKSGAGKTTIVDLLLRLLQPEVGEILVDGVDISEIEVKDWRRNIGYVPQDIFVISGTIEDNVRFYDERVSNEDIINAARKAQIYDFIQNQPNQLGAGVGERGGVLSGGEKQRLVLARHLAKNSQILIMDEATSALDNKSEREIQKAIVALKGSVTIFVIAHRLSTILDCDRVIYLANGKVQEEGSPKELLENKDSYFYKLYNIGDHAR